MPQVKLAESSKQTDWIFIVFYSVDMEPFHKLKKENFDHAAIECLTSSGIVPPRSWFPIKLRFSPLEFTDYSVSTLQEQKKY